MRNDLRNGWPCDSGEKGRDLREPQLSESAAESLAVDLINRKTKPPGSLGMLEKFAVRVAGLQRTITPNLSRKRICVYAASHGVCEENVSAYPVEVTRQMVLNFLS